MNKKKKVSINDDWRETERLVSLVFHTALHTFVCPFHTFL
jgi:alkyl hydroperoxide reductase subunit AhpC